MVRKRQRRPVAGGGEASCCRSPRRRTSTPKGSGQTPNRVLFHARHPFTAEWIITTIPLDVAEAVQWEGEA